MPQTTFKALELIKNSHTSYEDLAKVLEMDQATATRVLRMANSPYYGMSGKVSSIKYASAVLGLKAIGQTAGRVWTGRRGPLATFPGGGLWLQDHRRQEKSRHG